MERFNISSLKYIESEGIEDEEILYETALYYANVFITTILCTIFSLFGVISNIINMAVFSKIGFKDSINMSLFALAISDLGSCLFMFPVIVGLCPWTHELGLPVEWTQFAHIAGAWPHIACTKITTLITAFIIFERCLCVSVPLKVKTIITRGRTTWFLWFSFFIVLGAMAPLFYSNQLGWRFDPVQNQSILVLVFAKEREDIEKVVIPFINAFISLFAFIFIIISTIVLVVTLKRQSKWRQGAAAAAGVAKSDNRMKKGGKEKGHNNNITTKEQSISKMVVIISTLFIASLFPSVVVLLILWTDRRFDHGGLFFNLFVIMAMITNTLETVNAAMNIVIYYTNSSNYKAMFDQIFPSRKNKRRL